MNEEKLPAYFHKIYLDTLTVFKRKEDAPPEIIYRAEMKPWVGLTEEEIKEIWLSGIDRGDDWLDVKGIARAIEAKLKERNT
jgi:hypothetical protein